MAKRKYRAIVGIEAAIVLIAFVIVAAALAFVTLNMGFFTTQKSQQVISSGLKEASTALEVDGSVLAYSATGSKVNFTIIPLRVSPGRGSVDLDPSRAAIIYWLSDAGSFADIYKYYGFVEYDSTLNQYNLTVYDESGSAWITDADIGTAINTTAIWDAITTQFGANKPAVVAVMIWIDYTSTDTNLDLGEKAMLMVIFYDTSVQPSEYDQVKFEIKPPTGAPLTVERSMPPGIGTGVIDLG